MGNEMAQEALEKTKGIVDIVFLLDVSGSMQPSINALRDNINSFVDSLATPDANGGSPVKDWRIKVSGYRDSMADGQQWWVDFPFATSIAEVKSSLASLEAKGGGDEPESLIDALFKISTMPSTERMDAPNPNMWRHRHSAARVVIFFTDATYHPKVSIPEAKGATVDDVGREIQNARIILVGYCPEHDCYQDLAAVDRSILEFVGDMSNAVQAMVEYTSDPNHFRQALAALAKTVSQSADTAVAL